MGKKRRHKLSEHPLSLTTSHQWLEGRRCIVEMLGIKDKKYKRMEEIGSKYKRMVKQVMMFHIFYTNGFQLQQ